MSNIATHYRQAEDLLEETENMADGMEYAERARLLALIGAGHALLALAPPMAVAGAQSEREQMTGDRTDHEAAQG